MPFTVFKPLANKITAVFSTWTGLEATVISWLYAPILAALTIKLMWDGFNAIRGVGGNMLLLDIVLSNLRILIVWWAALTGGMYAANVVGFFKDLRTDLTGLFVPGAPDGYTALDLMMTNATAALTTAMTWASSHISFLPPETTGLVALACAFFMVTCMAIFAVVSVVNLLFVDLTLALLFAIGPLFVACYAFKATARFFDSWLGAVLKYLFTAVVITAIVSMAIAIMSKYAVDLEAAKDTLDFVSTAFAALGASGVLIVFASRAPSVAADIVGGIGINAVDFSRAAGPLGQAAAAAGRGAAGAASSAASGAGNAVAYGAGMASGSSVGRSVATSAPAQKAMSIISGAASFASKTSSVLSGSAGSAYRAGRDGLSGTGNITSGGSNQRPLGRPTGANNSNSKPTP